MTRLTGALLVLTFFAIWPSTEGMSGPNPCHRGRSFQTVATTNCTGIYIPPRMCRRCNIREIADNGAFPNCEMIYDLNESCLSGIQDYVDENPCDEKRREQLENQTPQNLRLLDFFIYAVCEECCDCIPFGAEPDEYDDRKAQGNQFLTSLERGNCPVHARFDICAIWPTVGDVALPGRTLNTGRTPVCPIIEDWFQSPLSANWQTTTVTMPNRIRQFLRRFNRVTRCRNKSVWQECAALEVAQGRI